MITNAVVVVRVKYALAVEGQVECPMEVFKVDVNKQKTIIVVLRLVQRLITIYSYWVTALNTYHRLLQYMYVCGVVYLHLKVRRSI